MECGLIRLDGVWVQDKPNPLKSEVSHTYCECCKEHIQKKIRVLKDFKDWDFRTQIQQLKKEISGSVQKYDMYRLQYLLKEQYQIEITSIPQYTQALQEYLIPALCIYCMKEIESNHMVLNLLNCKLHSPCFSELSEKMDYLLKNKWEKSNNLEAYLDLLKIKKELRPAVKKQLEYESYEGDKRGKSP